MVQDFSGNLSTRSSIRHLADNVPYDKNYDRLPSNDKLSINALFQKEPNNVQLYDEINRSKSMFVGEIASFIIFLSVFAFINASQFKLIGLELLLYSLFIGVGSLTISHLTFKFIKHIIFKRKRHSQNDETFMLDNLYANYLNDIIEFEDKRLIRRYRFIDVSRSTSDFLYLNYDYPSKVKKIHYKKSEDLSTDELAVANACPDERLSVKTLSEHVTGIIDTLKTLEEEERQKEYQKTYDTYLKANQTHVETRDISSLQEVEQKLQNMIHDHQQNIKKRSDNND